MARYHISTMATRLQSAQIRSEPAIILLRQLSAGAWAMVMGDFQIGRA